MDMAARILDNLRQSPFSVEELAFDLKRKPFEFRLSVNGLLCEASANRFAEASPTIRQTHLIVIGVTSAAAGPSTVPHVNDSLRLSLGPKKTVVNVLN
jgi:hypothetical protein